MQSRSLRLWIVEGLSLFRLVAALTFAALAFQEVPRLVVASVYALAMVSDLLDGTLARKLQAETYFGKVVDLVSDKSLTIVSVLYAAERGIDILPLALVATREIIMIGVRIILVDGTQLLPTNRILGGIMAFALWGNTLLLVVNAWSVEMATRVFWLCAIILMLNLFARIHASRRRLMASLGEDDQ